MKLLAVIKNAKWTPGVGDPGLIPWVIVAAYLTAAVICGISARNARKQKQTKLFVFWVVITLLMAALAVNKQLDLQTWLVQIAKDTARKQGWYEHRQAFQIIVSAVMGAFGLFMIALAGIFLRSFPQLRFTLIGLILLLTFIVIRAVSLESINNLLGNTIFGIKLIHLLELAAIICLAISPAANLFTGQKSRKPDS